MNLPYRRGWRTNGWAAGAASAFASCRHVVPHALGGNGPKNESCPLPETLADCVICVCSAHTPRWHGALRETL